MPDLTWSQLEHGDSPDWLRPTNPADSKNRLVVKAVLGNSEASLYDDDAEGSLVNVAARQVEGVSLLKAAVVERTAMVIETLHQKAEPPVNEKSYQACVPFCAANA